MDKLWHEVLSGFVLPRLKKALAALHGWERYKIWTVNLEFVFAKF